MIFLVLRPLTVVSIVGLTLALSPCFIAAKDRYDQRSSSRANSRMSQISNNYDENSELRVQTSPSRIAILDLVAALKRYPLVAMLGWQDIRQRYRRSAIGPFWLTISMGVLIGSIGLVFGNIFRSPLDKFLPFLTIGIVFWNFITNVVSEGCTAFILSEGIIKQMPMPLFVHIFYLEKHYNIWT
jgi:hypothetical protein